MYHCFTFAFQIGPFDDLELSNFPHISSWGRPETTQKKMKTKQKNTHYCIKIDHQNLFL